MEFVRRQDDIGIVVVGNFDPTRITPKWMYEQQIISEEEWNGQDRNIIVSPPGSQFRFGSVNFLSQQSRIQMTSTSIADSGRLKRMAQSILIANGETELRAVGVNAGLLFTFRSVEDSDRFGDYFSHIDHMNTFMDGGKLREIIFESQGEPTSEIPKSSVTIASVNSETTVIRGINGEPDTRITVPVCTININNHFVVTNQEEAFSIIDRAEVLHEGFREKYQRMFAAI